MPQDRLAKKRYNISLKVILSVFEFSSEMLLRRSAVRSAESAPGLTICKVGLVYNTLLKLILELFNIRGGHSLILLKRVGSVATEKGMVFSQVLFLSTR